MKQTVDLRKDIFRGISENIVTACIYTDTDGILCGVEDACRVAETLGLNVDYFSADGASVYGGDLVLQISGSPEAIATAEDTLIGMIAKPSGVATAAKRFVHASHSKLRIVSGSWKKIPSSLKPILRKAVETGGAHVRISDKPMVYLDKNYVEMLGGIRESLLAVGHIQDREKVIQVRGRNGDIVYEAWEAVCHGAHIVYVDTGNVEDACRVCSELKPLLRDEFEHVKIAFGGGVTLADMEHLSQLPLDIVGVGRAIIDAPLMDLRMEVTNLQRPKHNAHNYNLLSKNELKIESIYLDGTNLNALSAIVAQVLGVDEQNVMVIDVRDGNVSLDILQKDIDPHAFVGQEEALLYKLSLLPGVTLTKNTHVSSRGMMGWIVGEDSESMRNDLDRSAEMAAEIQRIVSRRVMVFSSGIEVERGEIEDTNAPLIRQHLEACGFETAFGGVLKDDTALFAGALRRASEQGYGVIITTGGVGAEDKDHSVEAVMTLDKHAATPYIVKFVKGHGRHKKDGIRISVGIYQGCLLITLPGPNDEVAACMDTLAEGLVYGWSKQVLAWKLAEKLRERWKLKMLTHK